MAKVLWPLRSMLRFSQGSRYCRFHAAQEKTHPRQWRTIYWTMWE